MHVYTSVWAICLKQPLRLFLFSRRRQQHSAARRRWRHLSRKSIVLFRPRSRRSSSTLPDAFPTATLDNLAPSLPLTVPRAGFPLVLLLHLLITPRLNDSWLPQYCIVRAYSQNVLPKRRFRWRFLSVSLRYRARHPFNARRPNISAGLGFNMWKGSRAYRRLIASYFRPAGKTGKLTAQYIAGMKARERERERGSPANERAREQGQRAALTLLIVATDEYRHCIGDESFFPVLPGGEKKSEKYCRAHHRPSHRFASHPFESARPALFSLYITISATCSPGNNRFTGRIHAELTLYTRRG